MNRKCFLFALLMPLFALVSANATSYAPFTFEQLQGLTHSGDTVLLATIESITLGQRGDIYKKTTDTKVQCLVVDVFVGDEGLKHKKITVVSSGVDKSFEQYAKFNEAVLLLLTDVTQKR